MCRTSTYVLFNLGLIRDLVQAQYLANSITIFGPSIRFSKKPNNIHAVPSNTNS